MGKKKKKNNSLKIAIQAQKKKGFQTNDDKKLFSEADEILKEKKKSGIKGHPIIFVKKKIDNKDKESGIEGKDDKNLEIGVVSLKKLVSICLINFFDVKDLVSLLLMNTKENLQQKLGEFDKLIDNNRIAGNSEKVISFFSNKDYEKLKNIRNDIYLLGTGKEKIYRNFFIYMITIYENFLENMMRFILKVYPNMLSKEKSLTYNDFKNFTSIDEIQNFYIESTIHDNMDGGVIKQIGSLEVLLQYKNKELKNVLPTSDLIEISNRRNLYVHNEGKINDQYIKKCKEGGKDISEDKINQELIIDKEYFHKSFYILLEIILKIAYFISYKCFQSQEDLTKINTFFNSLMFKLISSNDNEQLSLSTKMLDFLFNQIQNDKKQDIKSKQYYLINLALCYKMQSENLKAKELLNNQIFYDATPNFKLAIAVINEKWDEASSLMRICSVFDKDKYNGKEDDDTGFKFSQKDYKDFPIFFEFRKRDEFKEEYKKIYGEDFFEEDELN